MSAKRPVHRPAEQRFWEKVSKGEGCWEWTASGNENGYGLFYDNARLRNVKAHRFSWELHTAQQAPQGMDVCHTCDNRRCVRPDHLFLGTRKDNMQDAKGKGRLRRQHLPTHCKNGHEFTPENTHYSPRQRVCRKCKVINTAKYQARVGRPWRKRKTIGEE